MSRHNHAEYATAHPLITIPNITTNIDLINTLLHLAANSYIFYPGHSYLTSVEIGVVDNTA
jgi:hypothetical protein